MAMTRDQARIALATLRLAIGAGATLAPRPMAKLFGISPEDNPQAPALGRLFGIRDVALAAPLLSDDLDGRRRWLGYGAAVDAADAVALVAGGLRGYLPKRTVLLGAATALTAAALGIYAQGD